MPDPFLSFLNNDLIRYVAIMAAFVVIEEYRDRPRREIGIWMGRLALTSLLSVLLFIVGAALYYLPPMWRATAPPEFQHTTANSFPSHHALAAALLVAGVLLARPRRALPFLAVSVLIDWSLVASQSHYAVDVLASSAFVVVGTVLSILLVPDRLHRAFQSLLRLRNRRAGSPPHRVQPGKEELRAAHGRVRDLER